MNLDPIDENDSRNVVQESEIDEEDYEDDYGSSDKWRYSIYSAIVFLIISSPYTYLLIDKLIGSFAKVSSPTGCPTLVGLFIHTAVFALIIRGMMELEI